MLRRVSIVLFAFLAWPASVGAQGRGDTITIGRVPLGLCSGTCERFEIRISDKAEATFFVERFGPPIRRGGHTVTLPRMEQEGHFLLSIGDLGQIRALLQPYEPLAADQARTYCGGKQWDWRALLASVRVSILFTRSPAYEVTWSGPTGKRYLTVCTLRAEAPIVQAIEAALLAAHVTPSGAVTPR